MAAGLPGTHFSLPSRLASIALFICSRPELGIPRADGIVQLSRVLAGLFQVRITAASKAKPGSQYPVRVRVDSPSSGRPLYGVPVELTLTLGDDDENAVKHKVVTDLAAMPPTLSICQDKLRQTGGR